MKDEMTGAVHKRMIVDSVKLLRWARLPPGRTRLQLGTLCRHWLRVGPGTLDGFFHCGWNGWITIPARKVFFDEEDIMMFVTSFDEEALSMRSDFVRPDGDGVFMSRYGLVKGSFKDIQINVT